MENIRGGICRMTSFSYQNASEEGCVEVNIFTRILHKITKASKHWAYWTVNKLDLELYIMYVLKGSENWWHIKRKNDSVVEFVLQIYKFWMKFNATPRNNTQLTAQHNCTLNFQSDRSNKTLYTCLSSGHIERYWFSSFSFTSLHKPIKNV